jgi:hypothetical protein
MPIKRADRRGGGYTYLPNAALQRTDLSITAKGLLVLMLSYPDDWRFTLGWLERQHPAGRMATRTALRELEDAGYAWQQRSEVAVGRWTSEWWVSDTPRTPSPAAATSRKAPKPATETAPAPAWDTTSAAPWEEVGQSTDVDTTPADKPAAPPSPIEPAGVERVVAQWQTQARGRTAQAADDVRRVVTTALRNGVDETALVDAITVIVDAGDAVKDWRLTQALNGTYRGKDAKSIHYAADKRTKPTEYLEAL